MPSQHEICKAAVLALSLLPSWGARAALAGLLMAASLVASTLCLHWKGGDAASPGTICGFKQPATSG